MCNCVAVCRLKYFETFHSALCIIPNKTKPIFSFIFLRRYRNIWYKSKNDTTVQESVNKVGVYNFVYLTSWTWFLLFVLLLALLLCCLAVVMRLMCCTCPKNFQSCTSSHMHEGGSDSSNYEGHPDMAMDA